MTEGNPLLNKRSSTKERLSELSKCKFSGKFNRTAIPAHNNSASSGHSFPLSTERPKTFTGSTSTRIEAEHVVALVEGHAREIGIAVYNVKTMEMHLTQFADKITYIGAFSTLNVFFPKEILLPQVFQYLNQAAEGKIIVKRMSKLFKRANIRYLSYSLSLYLRT